MKKLLCFISCCPHSPMGGIGQCQYYRFIPYWLGDKQLVRMVCLFWDRWRACVCVCVRVRVCVCVCVCVCVICTRVVDDTGTGYLIKNNVQSSTRINRSLLGRFRGFLKLFDCLRVSSSTRLRFPTFLFSFFSARTTTLFLENRRRNCGTTRNGRATRPNNLHDMILI